MFEVPESDIVAIKIDEEVILGNKPIEFIRSPPSTETTSGESDASRSESSESAENVRDERDAKAYA